MMRHRFFLVPIIPCVCALLFLAGCARQAKEEEESHLAPLVAVRCAQIVEGVAPRNISATGRTDLLRREKIFAPVAGVLVELRVLEGARVNAGEVVAVILPKESQAAIAGAEALLRNARDDRERNEAERALRLARETQTKLNVVARNGGVVSTRSVSAGELVAENAELLSIADLSSLVFLADVPARDVAEIRTGLCCRVRLASAGGDPLAARVDAFLPQTDPQSQTAPVRLRFSDAAAAGLLRPGMAGTVDILVGTKKNALLVPRAALLRDDEKNAYCVVIVTPDSRALSVPVETESTGDSLVAISSPELRAGMPVIVEGQYALPDSTRVTVRGAGGR